MISALRVHLREANLEPQGMTIHQASIEGEVVCNHHIAPGTFEAWHCFTDRNCICLICPTCDATVHLKMEWSSYPLRMPTED